LGSKYENGEEKKGEGEENHDDKGKVKGKWKLTRLHMCKSRENGGKGACGVNIAVTE
jgi:hypothetical protein